MAKQIIFSVKKLDKEFPNHFEIVRKVKNLNDKMLSRLYKDHRLTAEKFLQSAKKHYPELKETDNLYFYTNQVRPALIPSDEL